MGLVGAVVALASLQGVEDARLLVGAASILGPLHAVWAERRLSRHADRSAGLLLAVSAVLTPTYFAYVINLPCACCRARARSNPTCPATAKPTKDPGNACPRVPGRDADQRPRHPLGPVVERRRKLLGAAGIDRYGVVRVAGVIGHSSSTASYIPATAPRR